MSSKNILVSLLFVPLIILSCQPAKETGTADNKLKVMATIFPLYDFARIIGGDKINVTMLLPPATDAHHYELKPDDIINVCKSDIFLLPLRGNTPVKIPDRRQKPRLTLTK